MPQTKPSIVIVTEQFPAISETFIVRQAQALKAMVICEVFNEELYERLQLDIPCYPIGRRSIIYHKGKNLLFRGGIYRNAWTQRQETDFISVLKKIKPERILAQFGPMGIKIANVLSKECLDIPLWTHFHGSDLWSSMLQTDYKKQLLTHANRMNGAIVVNNRMKDVLIKAGFSSEKVYIIPCGVRIHNRELAFENNNLEDVCHFLFVGRMVRYKGVFEVLKAFEHAAQKDSGIQITLVGSGKLLPKVKKTVARSPFRSRIHLTGPLTFYEIQNLYKQSDALAQHSTRPEGWSVTVGEAMEAGIPCLISESAATDALPFEDGRTGYVIPDGNIKLLHNRMLELVDNPGLRRKMGERGRSLIKEYGDLDQKIRTLKSVLS